LGLRGDGRAPSNCENAVAKPNNLANEGAPVPVNGSSHTLDVRFPATLARHLGRFYSEKVVRACQAHGARFSALVRLQKSHHELIDAIPEED
jgi:hypothetical protein